MIPAHPHDIVGMVQWIFWGDTPKETIFNVELVDWYKAPRFSRAGGWYVVFYALAHSDLDEMGVRKDDDIILFIPHKTYCTALYTATRELRTATQRQFGEGKNLFLRMKKLSDKRTKFLYGELREPKPEQLVEAKKHYEQIREEEKEIKNKHNYKKNEQPDTQTSP